MSRVDISTDEVDEVLGNLEGAELNVYLNDGGMFSMDLTRNQLGAALAVLGFKMLDPETYKVFSDKVLAEEVIPRLYRLNFDHWAKVR